VPGDVVRFAVFVGERFAETPRHLQTPPIPVR
jgi:hypothetical protein